MYQLPAHLGTEIKRIITTKASELYNSSMNNDNHWEMDDCYSLLMIEFYDKTNGRDIQNLAAYTNTILSNLIIDLYRYYTALKRTAIVLDADEQDIDVPDSDKVFHTNISEVLNKVDPGSIYSNEWSIRYASRIKTAFYIMCKINWTQEDIEI